MKEILLIMDPKKYVTLGEDNVSASMYEIHFQSTHLSFNDLSYINGLKPNDQTYLCGKSYWTGVELKCLDVTSSIIVSLTMAL